MTDLLQLGLFYLLIYFTINGIDEIVMDLRMTALWLRNRKGGGACLRLPGVDRMRRAPAQRIAILVPLWRESAVIEAMVETNLRHVNYPNFDFFLGVYPNDTETLHAAQRLQAKHPRVHVVINSRPGPTSKADCLNHVYREIGRFEARNGIRFPVLMLHDAEDVLHPASLLLVNWYSVTYGMVQVPVLPIATPLSAWMHGVYCDEFAEFFQRDLSVRHTSGGFLPSNGVGTAFSRECLDALFAEQNGVLLDEESLTEDYEIGHKLHRLGCKQILLPLTRMYGDLLATREYFPRTFRDAVRQRTRWISGQCLQSWERNGWPLRWQHSYWFWRDRKGLWGNSLNAMALLLLVVGLTARAAPELTGLGPWLWMAGSVPGADALFVLCTVFSLQRVVLRTWLVSRIYGWRFATGVPIRMVLSTALNFVATWRALHSYAMARWQRKRLGWLKTEHAFPIGAPVAAEAAPVLHAFTATAAGADGAAAAWPGWGTARKGVVSTSTAIASGVHLAPISPQHPPAKPHGAQTQHHKDSLARAVLLKDGEVLVVIPRNLAPQEREQLTRHHVARLSFVEEERADLGSTTD